MNVRQAILATAALFERDPSAFDFNKIRVPDCNTPGCAIGWICAFSGVAHSEYIGVGREILGVSEEDFYHRMNEFQPHTSTWCLQADWCAEVLRLYADRYHPAPKVHGIPSSVRAIFETKQTEAAIQSFL